MLRLKSKRTRAAERWLYNHPRTTLALIICAFLFIFLPQWGASVWQLFSNKPFFDWLTEKMQTTELAFSLNWITVPVGFFVLFLILYLLWAGRRKAGTDDSQAGDTVAAQEVAEGACTEQVTIKELQGRIKELEGELKDETKKYKSELSQKEGLRELRDSLESRWKGHVFQYSWLFAKVEAQGQGMSSYVEVEKVYFCYQELETPMLKSVFGIDFRNKSIFDITIEEKVGEHIIFEGVELEVSPRIISHPGTVKTGEVGTITLEQRLTRPEADLIASTDPKFAEFDLTNLVITITGEHFASNQPQHLEIPKRLHTDLQAEIDALKAEIVTQRKNHEAEFRKFKDERQAVELQLWERIRIADRLSKVLGYAAAIEAKCQQSNMEYPKDEIDKWAEQLWYALDACYGEKDVEKFYSHIDDRCPGYERGAVKVLKVPEFNAERHLWFYYHRKRLWELINEQHHGGTIVSKGESQG